MDQEQDKVAQVVGTYQTILQMLLSHQDSQGISRISQTEIASRMDRSQSAIANKFKFLRKYGLIEKVGPHNAYKVLNTNLLSKTPFGTIFSILNLLEDHPEVYGSLKLQSEILGISIKELQTAWGFWTYFNGSKYQKTLEGLDE